MRDRDAISGSEYALRMVLAAFHGFSFKSHNLRQTSAYILLYNVIFSTECASWGTLIPLLIIVKNWHNNGIRTNYKITMNYHFH